MKWFKGLILAAMIGLATLLPSSAPQAGDWHVGNTISVQRFCEDLDLSKKIMGHYVLGELSQGNILFMENCFAFMIPIDGTIKEINFEATLNDTRIFILSVELSEPIPDTPSIVYIMVPAETGPDRDS